MSGRTATVTAIYGPGGFGRELILSNPARSRERVIFISDSPEEVGRSIEGVPVHDLDAVVAMSGRESVEVVISVSDHAVRRRLARKLEDAGLSTGQLIAPTAIVGAGVQLGEGAILCEYSMVTASARIGRHFQANIYAYVAHDCVVGDFVTLAPKACVNGNVVLEDDVYVGTGALIRQGRPGEPLVIGAGAVIGMGAVVTRNVPAGAVVVGNPARSLDRPA